MDKRLAIRQLGAKAKETYQRIRRHGVLSKTDLLAQTGLPVSTLTRLLDDLLAQNLLEEAGLGESSGGRRPVLYRTNPTYANVFGLDISRTVSRLAATDMHGQVLESMTWEMGAETTPDRLLTEVERSVRRMCDAYGLMPAEILGLGIGAVGPVDRERGMILEPQYFPAPGWCQVELCGRFERELGFPVILDNGANTAIMAEYWADAPHEIQHALYVRAGVGLRSSMISGGQLVYGAVDMEGAVGQMIIQTDGIPHRDPRAHTAAWNPMYRCTRSNASCRPGLRWDGAAG